MERLCYLLGAEVVTDNELETLGIEVAGKTDSGSRMLKIPEQSLSQYVRLIKAKLTKGFWNEIVGPKDILFIFRFKDGHTEEFAISPKNEQQIDKLCAEFNDEPPEKTANVYKYISDNDFYHDFMLEHYADMINR